MEGALCLFLLVGLWAAAVAFYLGLTLPVRRKRAYRFRCGDRKVGILVELVDGKVQTGFYAWEHFMSFLRCNCGIEAEEEEAGP